MSEGFFSVELISLPDPIHHRHIYYLQNKKEKNKRRKVAEYDVEGDRIILNAEVKLVMTRAALQRLNEEVNKSSRL